MDVQESITELCPPSECGRARRDRGGLPALLDETAGLFRQIASPRDEPASDPEASYRESTLAEARSAWRADGPEVPLGQPGRQPAVAVHHVPRPGWSRRRGPTLHFLHLLMPHTPWNYLPSGTRYDAPEDLPLDGRRLGRDRPGSGTWPRSATPTCWSAR